MFKLWIWPATGHVMPYRRFGNFIKWLAIYLAKSKQITEKKNREKIYILIGHCNVLKENL